MTTTTLDLMLTATELIKQATIGPDCDLETLLENIEECAVAIENLIPDLGIGSHEWNILTNLHTILNLLESDMIP